MKHTPINEQEADKLAELLKRAIACGQLALHVKSPYVTEAEAYRDGWDWNDRHDGNAVSSDAWKVEHGMFDGEHVLHHDENDEPVWHDGPLATVMVYVDERDLATLVTCPNANQSN